MVDNVLVPRCKPLKQRSLTRVAQICPSAMLMIVAKLCSRMNRWSFRLISHSIGVGYVHCLTPFRWAAFNRF
jgi:hypothetical protein